MCDGIFLYSCYSGLNVSTPFQTLSFFRGRIAHDRLMADVEYNRFSNLQLCRPI